MPEHCLPPSEPPEPTPPDPRLVRLLGAEEAAWLIRRARRRLERGEPLIGPITLSSATPAQRDAVAILLGRRPRSGGALTVRLDAVDEMLRRSGVHAGGLAAAVVALTGPVVDAAAEAVERERAWDAAFAVLDATVSGRPELADWSRSLRATGAVRRLAGDPSTALALLTDLATALAGLPVEGEPIGRFSERTLGSAHALDDDRPLARLVFGAARAVGRVPDGVGAAWRRQVWAGVGLVRDDLSSTVLALGLAGDTSTSTGRMLSALREAGQPAVLTLRQLTRDPPALAPSGTVVSVCENPVVVGEAADRLGAAARPLVCVSGQPGAAAMHLLRRLATAGMPLRYHGDFDWGGLRIGNVLFARLSVASWRFDSAAYRAAAALGGGSDLRGRLVEAVWDSSLAPTMRELGRVVEEERTMDDLISDLGA
jgi:uncharacterized protein (TIGR02679 family)